MARRFYTVKSAGNYLANRDGGWYCHYCECEIKRNPSRSDRAKGVRQATIDHKTPLCHGGADNVKNLVLCCKPCNQEKGTWDYIFFRAMTMGRRLKARGEI